MIFTVGHSATHPGMLAADGRSEHEICSEVGLFLRGAGATVFWRSPDMYDSINALHPRGVIELHLDSRSITSPAVASGALALHWPHSRAGAVLALHALAATLSALHIPSLGVVSQSRSWSRVALGANGDIIPAGPVIAILQNIQAPSCVLELGNGKNPDDLRALARALADGSLVEALCSI